jgi:uncharacterized protein GlcG (DUF336 family)
MSITPPKLDLEHALQLARHALELAHQERVTAVTVVVTDAGGNIRCALRGDGVGHFGVDIAHAKCVTAVGFGRSSAKTAAVFADKPQLLPSFVSLTQGKFMPLGGGVVVVDASGAVVGAAAMAGSTPENDERFVTAAIKSIGLDVPA